MQTKNYTAAQTAFAASTTSGRLLGVQVTTQGSTVGAAITIYDNASAASGTVMFAANGSGVAATTAVEGLGWHQCGPVGIGLPFSNGLWVVSTASTGGAGIIVYSEGVVPFDGRPIQ